MDLFSKIPEGEMRDNLYTISFPAHCVRIEAAYKRERLWKGICIGTNLIWILTHIFCLVAR